MKKALYIVLAVAILALPLITLSDAFAGREDSKPAPQFGPGGKGHPGGPCASGDISDKDMEKMALERKAFLTETKDLRFRMEDKEWELGRELRADKPDEKKAMAIMKELSDLRGQFEQRMLAHKLKMRAMFPEFHAFGRGFGPGPGCGEGDGEGCGQSRGQGREQGRGPCAW